MQSADGKSSVLSASGSGAIGRDPDAFEAFYRAHVEAVERFVARRVSDRQRAADLTADIFVAVIEASETYRADRGTPEAWLFGVARRVVVGDLRRRGRERRATGRFLGRQQLDSDDAERIDERLDAEAQSRQLYESIAQLPAGQRAVLELVAVDGLSVAEAAGALGISPLAARVRLHRARSRMTDKVSDPANPSAARPQEAAP
jgi:RNA polymerase sigma-70 factor (ECF subfamily)